MFHKFNMSHELFEMPKCFNNPFYYEPHHLCKLAAQEVQTYLSNINHQEGKMFGVLIVKTSTGEIGYLAAFSGLLNGSNQHSFFVPPIYDLLHHDGYFKYEEKNISAINSQINNLKQSDNYINNISLLASIQKEFLEFKQEAKQKLKQAKEERDKKRDQTINDDVYNDLIRESQYMKAEFKRQEKELKLKVDNCQLLINNWNKKIDDLKTERKKRSAALQNWLFNQYILLNYTGETKTLLEIFNEREKKIPPGGSGECAGPKLLQYAYLNKLIPTAMAEFWWGKSPNNEIRKAGSYYPACQDKCKPILSFMLKGLEIEENPLETHYNDQKLDIDIIYEDQYIVAINKPAGVLTVPGKNKQYSIYEWAKNKYPNADGPLIVHRLDMDTSGILIIAKNKTIHKLLQEQFTSRVVSKRYIAIIEFANIADEGVISLPLCCDPTDRPRQMVNDKYGKEAVTHYKIVQRYNDRIKIAFYPITGRTHQLRVHAAHPHGLNAPIIGDNLYGTKNVRLFLHAERICFRHPVTNEEIIIEKESEF